MRRATREDLMVSLLTDGDLIVSLECEMICSQESGVSELRCAVMSF